MDKERLYLFDTTLRDGQQTPGIDFSVEDKIAIARLLDEFGIDYVEGGYPGANPTDTAFFSQKRTTTSRFVAFGMTKRAGVSASNDPGLAALIAARSDAVCFVAKSWDYHVEVALGCTNEENLEAIRASVEATVAAGKEAMVDCEHFFDGYKAQSRLRARLREDRPRGRRALGRALRHQRRHAADGDPRDRLGPDRGRHPGRASRHPRPQRHRPGGGQLARGRRRPACARSRARSTASASAAATPTSSPSFRRSR